MKHLSRLLLLLALTLLMVFPAQATYPSANTTDFQGGLGTQAEPYLVSTATHLDNVRKYPNAHFKQVATIYLDGYSNWTPIGSSSAPFKGTYDGNGYAIYGLTINSSGSANTNLGLFGYSNGYISGVKLQNVTIIGNFTYGTNCNIGAVVGYSGNDIAGCSVSGTIQCTLPNNGANIGGIVGYGNAVSYCQNTADITVLTSGSSPSSNQVSIGGISGSGYDDYSYCSNSGDLYSNCSNTEMGGISGGAWTLVGCSNSGSVTLDTFSTASANYGTNWNQIGGITGYLVSSAQHCTNTGAITASGYECEAGGIAGFFEGGGTIDQCRVSGSISTTSESGSANTISAAIGGVVGLAQDGDITNCYAVGTVKLSNNGSSLCYNGGIVGELASKNSTVSNCYSLVTSISANTSASSWSRGALVGLNWGTVSNCYWSSYSWGVGVNRGTNSSKSVTLSKLNTQSTYSGFDFTNTWKMGTGTYTYATLRMESGHTHTLSYTPANYNCANGGKLEHWYCSGCNTYFKEQGAKPVPERMILVYTGDHTYDFDKEPTGTYGGHVAFACIDCGTALYPDGQCGKTAWYNIIGESLYIYGSGAMYDYTGYSATGTYGNTPWQGKVITYADIKKGITTVGQGAFYYGSINNSYQNNTNKYLTTVRLPEGLLTIDKSAFSYCTALKTINIPDSVNYLGMYAFRDCSALETISLNTGTVNSYCFEYCSSLKEITFGPNLYTIANTVFDKGSTRNETLKITFLGNAPTFDSIAFNRQTVEVHYPLCNTTWTESVRKNYSGTATWIADGSHTPGTPTQINITPATCTEDGSYTNVIACQTCHVTMSSTPVTTDKLGHSFTNYISNNDATCIDDGTKTAKCDRCEVKDTQTDAGSAKGHAYDSVVTAPTCTEIGFTTHTCHCGDTYVDSEVPALDHSFTNYISNNDATCIADGTTTAKCDRCEETDTQADGGSKLGHSFTNYVSNNDATCVDDGTKTAKCDRCEETDTQADGGSKLGHSFTNYISNNDATCIDDGTKTAKCDRCEVKDTKTDVGSAKGHEFDSVVTAPTCTEIGYTTHTCHCGDTFTDSIVDALEHSFTNYISNNDATCTADGTKTAQCDRCDVTHTKTDAFSKLGHSFTDYVSDGNATCLDDGTQTAKCDRCSVTQTKAENGSKLGHSFTNYVSRGDATCVRDGNLTAQCDRCSAVHSKTDPGSKLGHSFTNYISNNDATCIEDGTKTAKCDRCEVKDTQTDVGSAKGHAYDSVVTAPTCTEIGYTSHTCHCGHRFVDSEVSALDHSFTNYVSDNNATYDADGTRTAKCDRCDATNTITDPGTKLQAINGWVMDSGIWYYYKNNKKQTGWVYSGGAWYFMDSTGKMQTGWVYSGGAWYFMSNSGAMVTGWLYSAGTWYYMDYSGAMATGWQYIGGCWYYFYGSGAMATGWVYDGGWYYLQASGAMAIGWQWIDGYWYYFYGSGAMATGWVLDGGVWYYMNSSGVWIG